MVTLTDTPPNAPAGSTSAEDLAPNEKRKPDVSVPQHSSPPTASASDGAPDVVAKPELNMEHGSVDSKPAPPTTSTSSSKSPTASETAAPPAATTTPSPTTKPKVSSEQPPSLKIPPTIATADDGVNPLDFAGSVDSNNDLPSAETIARIGNYVVLDRHGKSHTFKSLYAGKHVARRVLVIFVRHFFCGQCQEYLKTLSASITPDALLRLPISTFIAVVGCGDPALIDMYTDITNCPFPVYADPTRKLYSELGMIRTLAPGPRPAYATKNILKTSLEGIVQGLKQIPKGLANKSGDMRQIGGEFLFEPMEVQTPWQELERSIGSVSLEPPNPSRKSIGNKPGASSTGAGKSNSREHLHYDSDDPKAQLYGRGSGGGSGASSQYHRDSEASLDGKFDEEEEGSVEEKRVTWCHRMKTTRDHAEIPELMEVLGLDGQGMPVKDAKRWSRALEQRKGTGLSMASQISAMKKEAGQSPSPPRQSLGQDGGGAVKRAFT